MFFPGLFQLAHTGDLTVYDYIYVYMNMFKYMYEGDESASKSY